MPKLAPPLTETQILGLAPRAKRYKIGDGRGLCLVIDPSGKKFWHMDYKRSGKETSLRLGTYPYLSLADARIKRDEANRLIAENIDPVEQRREARKKEQDEKPKTRKFLLSTINNGGMVIETHSSRIALNSEQVAALTAFLIATPDAKK